LLEGGKGKEEWGKEEWRKEEDKKLTEDEFLGGREHIETECDFILVSFPL
jgi:hypothetical protein